MFEYLAKRFLTMGVSLIALACVTSCAESDHTQGSNNSSFEAVSQLQVHPLEKGGELLIENAVVKSSLIAGYISAVKVLEQSEIGITQGAPSLNTASVRIEGLAEANERFWEVKFFDKKTSRLMFLVFVNAENGRTLVVCKASCFE